MESQPELPSEDESKKNASDEGYANPADSINRNNLSLPRVIGSIVVVTLEGGLGVFFWYLADVFDKHDYSLLGDISLWLAGVLILAAIAQGIYGISHGFWPKRAFLVWVIWGLGCTAYTIGFVVVCSNKPQISRATPVVQQPNAEPFQAETDNFSVSVGTQFFCPRAC